ncbi:beta-lactamase domain-containing protein 2-like isoform X2 [Patiria miniata]|uniref:Beta-lactamase-related domain-containing protein n=1 Tax=Patiria miniata TaxID=46514 RepID=A0A914BSG8_PATMI|nr:beta-lactamase domain-containing protein 2-like isoform X2 [Patiria miniata]
MAFMKSAILVCVTAVLTVYLPQLWTKTRPIITAGTVQPGFEPVAKLFRKNFENGVEYPSGGSAFSVYYKGSKVVDIWGGYADSEAGRPWKEDTISTFFSTTKGMAALCIAILVDRGLLDYDKTVASYWPEFAQNGKEKVTLRMLVNHQAGLSYTSEKVTLELMEDQDALGELLARSPPAWEPGTAHGYHAITFGLYLSQVVRRADPKHRTLGQFFKQEIAEPFGIDFFIGLPLESFHRNARLMGNANSVLLSLLRGLSSPLNRQLMLAMATGKSDMSKILEVGWETVDGSVLMRPETLALEQPSAYGVGTARAIATVYGILANGGRTKEGKKLLSDNIIKKIISEAQIDGSIDRTLGLPTVNNLGFLIDEYEGSAQFGHPGSGGMQGRADPQKKIGLSYLSSYNSEFGFGDDPRFTSLQAATHKCIEELEAKRP